MFFSSRISTGHSRTFPMFYFLSECDCGLHAIAFLTARCAPMYYVFMLSWQIAVFASYCLGLPRHSFRVSPRQIFICRFDGISSAPAEGDVRIRQYHCSQPSHMKPHVCQKPYVSKKQWAEFGNLIQPIKAKKREVLRLVSSSEKTRF